MVKGVWDYLTRNEYDTSPKRISDPPLDPDIGAVAAEFEAYEPNPLYAKNRLPSVHEAYPQITPKNLPPVAPLDPPLRAIIDSLWKRAEPAQGAARGPVTMGMRGQATPVGPASKQDSVYHQHVNPLQTTGAAFTDDWKHLDTIQRTNAVTFRGDSRPPNWVLGRDMGFYPPNSRNDDFYLYGVVFQKFQDYMKRRYGRDIGMADYVSAMSGNAPTAEAKSLLINYMMWRKITEGEAFHLGRMVASEVLKGYISTSRSLPMATQFGTRYNAVSGWIYLTQVRGGFIVPPSGVKWGTKEQEIAQWGPISAANVVGFRRIDRFGGGLGPIYIRPAFRKTETRAFRNALDTLSHKPPQTLAG
jgi:hypothetical protein